MPIAQNGLNQRKRRHRGCIRAQYSRAQCYANDIWSSDKGRSLLFGETAFRTDQYGKRPSRRSYRHQRRDWIRYIGIFIAENQQPIGTTNDLIKTGGLTDGGHVQNSALLSSFDCIGPHAVEIHTRDLGVPRDHRLQIRHTHFHSLLDEIVEPRVLQWREQEMQIARSRLFSHTLFNFQCGSLSGS